jgi:uncharacterized protein YndB with AHSA1/START domain
MTQARTGALAVRMRRVIPGPPEAVYAAFLDPDTLRRWYAPEPYQLAEVEVDPRVGGRHYTVVVGPAGDRHENICELRELVPGRKIVMTWTYRGPHLLGDDSEQLLTVELFPLDDDTTTELRLRHERLATVESRDNVHDGWNSLLDQLERMNAGD